MVALIENGADMAKVDSSIGWTPLHACVSTLSILLPPFFLLILPLLPSRWEEIVCMFFCFFVFLFVIICYWLYFYSTRNRGGESDACRNQDIKETR